MPALGMQCTGTGEYSPRKRIASRMSSGPVEQLRPMTSTLSASSVASTDEMSVPRSILPPLGRRLTLAWMGTWRPVSLNASRMPKIAALTSRMSCAVSTISRSTPPSSRPWDCSVKTSTSSRKRIWPRLGSSDAGRKPGRADAAGDETILADGLAGDLGRHAVDLERVLGEPPLVELEPGGLERVGLDDLGTRLDHRLVHALDDVGPVEDERLMTPTGQAVVFSRERSNCSSVAPIPPSKTMTRSRVAARKSRIGCRLANLDTTV